MYITTLLISSLKKFVLPTEFYLDLRQQISWHCPFNVRNFTDEVKLQLQTFTCLPHQILFIRSEKQCKQIEKLIILYDLWKSVRFLYKNVEQFFAQKFMLQWFAGSSGQRRRMQRPVSRPASNSSFFNTYRFGTHNNVQSTINQKYPVFSEQICLEKIGLSRQRRLQ